MAAIQAQSLEAADPVKFIQEQLEKLGIKNGVKVQNGVITLVVAEILAEFQQQIRAAKARAIAA